LSINNIIPLSYNIADGKKRYVLFCGAGISKDAGIPTGWDILIETLRRIRTQDEFEKGEHSVGIKEYSNEKMEKYYEEYYKNKTYSEIIGSLFPAHEEQRAFLKEQFNGKPFGESHKLIARWVKEGLIRFIITTNFDTLLEQALDEVGLKGQYTVVSSGDEVLTSKPWNNVEYCRVYKIHGTIDQGRIRNTEKDLSQLDEDLQRDFSDIIERHGVIVVGYAGNKEDKAVIDTFSKRKFKGYTLHWCIHKTCNDGIKELVNEKQEGCFIKIASASDFLEEVLDRVELVRNEKELTSGRISQIKFKNIIASDSDVRIKQTIDEEKNKLIKFLKTALGEVDEKDYNSLWEVYVKIFNYSMNFLLLIDQIVMYRDTYWKYVLPIFEEIHSLNVTQNRHQKEGMINYLHFSLMEIVGALLLARKSFKCLNTLLKIKKLNGRRDGTENILDWNIQADFIEEKNDREANINLRGKLVVPSMGYFLKLIDTLETPLESDIKSKVLDVDLLYYVYSLANPLGKYFDFWYPQSVAYLRYGYSDTFKQIKYNEEFGNKIAEELFETNYNGLIAQIVHAKDHFEKNLRHGYDHFPFENPFKDFDIGIE
jgi:hypothetical protein